MQPGNTPKVDELQFKQDDKPETLLYFPTGHAEHQVAPNPEENVPGLQDKHADKPIAAEYVPLLQLSQEVVPPDGWNVPLKQGKHCCILMKRRLSRGAKLNDPIGHQSEMFGFIIPLQNNAPPPPKFAELKLQDTPISTIAALCAAKAPPPVPYATLYFKLDFWIEICADAAIDIAPPYPWDWQKTNVVLETVAVTSDPDNPKPPPFPIDLQPEKSDEPTFRFDPTVSWS
jgi:hypothetical protein